METNVSVLRKKTSDLRISKLKWIEYNEFAREYLHELGIKDIEECSSGSCYHVRSFHFRKKRDDNGLRWIVTIEQDKNTIEVKILDRRKEEKVWNVWREERIYRYAPEYETGYVWELVTREPVTPDRETRAEADRDFAGLGFKLRLSPGGVVQCNDNIIHGKSWVRHIVQTGRKITNL